MFDILCLLQFSCALSGLGSDSRWMHRALPDVMSFRPVGALDFFVNVEP
jgi:hypothetical protein